MNIFKVKPQDFASAHRMAKMERGANALNAVIKAMFGRESETRPIGGPDRPAMEVRVAESRAPELERDLGDQINEILRLFCSAIVYFREHSPGIVGDIVTEWKAEDLPDDVGAEFVGNVLKFNAKLGGLRRMKILREFMIAASPLVFSGLVVPVAPKGHSWADILRIELREGQALVNFDGPVVGHSERPGELKLPTGKKPLKIVARADAIQQLMAGFAPNRRGAATCRKDQDPRFGSFRYALCAWEWSDA